MHSHDLEDSPLAALGRIIVSAFEAGLRNAPEGATCECIGGGCRGGQQLGHCEVNLARARFREERSIPEDLDFTVHVRRAGVSLHPLPASESV